MNIFIFGKNDISIECTEIIKSNSSSRIVGVCPNNSDIGEDNWQKSLLKFSTKNSLPIFRFKNVKSKESIKQLKKLKIDFIFSFQYDQIINEEVIEQAKHGAINLHFGPLPKYRGVSPIAFALINGEKEFGVTIHYMNPGVDRGDIIDQIFFNIEDVKNGRELYELCVKMGVKLFKRVYEDIINFRTKRIPQDDKDALYYPLNSIDFSNNILQPNLATRVLYNWCRAFIFPPFQYPIFVSGNEKFKILSVFPDYRKNNFEKPGTIIIREKNYIKIATHDCYLNLIVDRISQ
jgi:methionyl-tRNA formyltransferase